MGIKHCCLIFGVTPTQCCAIINMMNQLDAKKLKNHPLAKVKFPDEEKMAYCLAKEPTADDASFLWMD